MFGAVYFGEIYFGGAGQFIPIEFHPVKIATMRAENRVTLAAGNDRTAEAAGSDDAKADKQNRIANVPRQERSN